ncbi:ankyrin repeat-containing protein, putative [Entamoeba invadens IP1]|uniref:ankyrin repeat-containing protein, putative n=1 Tax=Entamoeba invadens IP1 TaxID=370355 RepID=UPI0002C3F029|nr:ankyrin repeat-containing protein, putative [Entamoeba invadens IP1]ELP93351.1 ankyrin repeat-containing protein, putative [Entamoeba invadens IP1]|eukprot:XP_004260122.1 ankyrin repeat-containing protein, putative [Entamoeba invadens IP1]
MDVSVVTNEKNEISKDPLPPADESRLVDLVKMMDKGQADRVYAELTTSFPIWIGKSVRSCVLLFKAIEMGYLTLVETILHHAPNFLEITDARGNTPFLYAIGAGHFEIAQFFQEKGCNVTVVNSLEENGLHRMAGVRVHKKDVSFVNSLINALTEKKMKETGADQKSARGVDGKNLIGETPLHTAVKEDNVKLAEILIGCGADPTVLNNDGISPVVYAEANDERCAKLFRESVAVQAAIKYAQTNKDQLPKNHRGLKGFSLIDSIDDSENDMKEEGKEEKDKDKDKFKIPFLKSKIEKYEMCIDKLLQDNKPMKEYMLGQRVVGENKFRILSLDGCGVKVILQLLILKRIVEKFPHFLDNVDMICSVGTSTLPVLMSLVGFDIDSMITITEKTMIKVFSTTSHKGGVLSYKYSSKFVRILSSKIFQDKKLKDLKREVVIPVIKIDSGVDDPNRRMIPVLMNNIVFEKTNTDVDDSVINADDLLSDVVMRSFATPGFFTCHQSYVDGSFLINQPFAAAKAFYDPKESVVLSLSGGTFKTYFDSEKFMGAGYVQWATCVTELFRTAGIALADEFAKVMFGERAWRIDPKLPCEIDDDSFKDIELLKTVATKVDLTQTEEWILQNW